MSLILSGLDGPSIRCINASSEEISVNREVYPVEDRLGLTFNGYICLDPQPEKVIFHDPATIVYWTNGTKTVVKCGPHDTFDPEKGLAMAIAKKHFGNGNEFHKVFKRWVPDES